MFWRCSSYAEILDFFDRKKSDELVSLNLNQPLLNAVRFRFLISRSTLNKACAARLTKTNPIFFTVGTSDIRSRK